MLLNFKLFDQPLNTIPKSKIVINTINAHCYNIALKDIQYHQALFSSDVLIPDGISVVWAVRWLSGQKLKKIAGTDLFFYEMNQLQRIGGKCFFLGSSNFTLIKIRERLNREFPGVIFQCYSPPFKAEFTLEENSAMLDAINAFRPDVLMIGMTAPKQEKWAYQHFDLLNVGHICCVGAVFDFYGGTVNRAPQWMIKLGFEWFYRLIKEPKRMWRRYLIGNILFMWNIIIEKIEN